MNIYTLIDSTVVTPDITEQTYMDGIIVGALIASALFAIIVISYFVGKKQKSKSSIQQMHNNE